MKLSEQEADLAASRPAETARPPRSPAGRTQTRRILDLVAMRLSSSGPRRVGAFRQRPVVYSAMAAYAVASIGLMASRQVGLTAEHVLIIFLVGFAVVGRARPFVWDWLPFLFVAVMFEDLTSVGSKIAGAVHTVGPIVFEKTLLGGVVACSWLQEGMAHAPLGRLLGVVLSLVYLAHFPAPLLCGLWFWLRYPSRFGTFVGAFVLVTGSGFLIYLVFPEMPPWLAAQRGLLPPVQRIVVQVLQSLGGFGQFYAGADPEPNAAMPSLHVSVPMVIGLSLAASRGWRRPTAWLWLLYPLVLSFAVVYLGEHYIADVVVGLVLGGVCFAAVDVGTRLLGERTVPTAYRKAAESSPSVDVGFTWRR